MDLTQRKTSVQITYEQISGSNVEQFDPSEKRKVYDNIHGFIYFSQAIWDFIDTPHFQRLRRIKQLGCLQYVFPGATHTRFEHSIGTAYLAHTFMEILIQNNPKSYEKQDTKSAILTVTLAGLLHDLGHGPYSHTFDGYIVTQITKKGEQKPIEWTHEMASQALFQDLVYKQGLGKHLSQAEIERVKALIKGAKDGRRDWQFQIISNKTNGIDVDKLDYFRRDAFHLGAKNIFVDHELLMKEARIIEDDICYPTKYVETVYNIFHCRYKLYKGYYFNLASKGVELMICDVLKEIQNKFNFRRICQDIFEDPSDYIKLTDNIIERVEEIHDTIIRLKKQGKYCQDAEYEQNFKKARLILDRIKTRKIYKFVREFHYFIQQGTDPRILKLFKTEFTKQKIIDSISERANIPKDSICLSMSEVGFGLKQANPLKLVGFFRKELKKLIKLKPEEIQNLSMLYTNAYLQRSIKVFIKEDDAQVFEKVEKAFIMYCKSMNEKFQQNLQKKGLNVIFQGRGGRTPLYRTGENDKLTEGVQTEALPEFEIGDQND